MCPPQASPISGHNSEEFFLVSVQLKGREDQVRPLSRTRGVATGAATSVWVKLAWQVHITLALTCPVCPLHTEAVRPVTKSPSKNKTAIELLGSTNSFIEI